MTSILKLLKIPHNLHFHNLPVSHYEALVESNGYQPIHNAIVELLVYYKNDKKLSEKARTLLSVLDKQFLFESKKIEDECICGFKTLGEEHEKCPCCNTSLYNGNSKSKCFYLNDDKSCSQDGEECVAISRKECGK